MDAELRGNTLYALALLLLLRVIGRCSLQVLVSFLVKYGNSGRCPWIKEDDVY